MIRTLMILFLPLTACVIIRDGKAEDSGGSALHDCATTLPSDVRVVRGTIDAATNHERIWLCEGATANLAANGIVVWAETGGTVNASAAEVEIWAAGASTVNVSADDVAVHYEPDATVNIVGDAVLADACQTITFDASAVESPC